MTVEVINPAQISKDDLQSLSTISGRVTFMEELRQNKDFHRKPHAAGRLVLGVATRVVFAETHLRGQENLNFVRNKIGQGEFLTVAANHTSDADHSAIDLTLRSYGYEDLADHLVIASGLKMWDRWYIRWAMRGMSCFPMPAPAYYNEASRLSDLILSQDQRELIEKYNKDMNWLAKASLLAIRPEWHRGNIAVLVYPETTRSRDGYIQRGRAETLNYFGKGWILPLLIDGPRAVIPPEKGPNWGKIIRREGQVTLTAQEVISAERLMEPRTIDWLTERGANPVDFVMSRIVSSNPEKATLGLRPVYESLSEDIPEGLIVRAA